MGIFSVFRPKRKTPLPTSLYSPGVSGFSFGEINKNPTLIACTNVIANSISILPLNLYFKDQKTGSRKKAPWKPLYSVLRRRPNTHDSPTLFMSKLIRHILQKGNAYIYKQIEGGEVMSLVLLNPEAVREEYDGWKTTYWYNSNAYTEDQILHISSLITNDHGKGIATVDLARAAVILGVQLDETSLSSFSNGINTKLLIDIAEMTANISDLDQAQKVAQTVADYVRRNYAGADNAGKPLILWTGMQAKELTHQSSNRDAELLESRKWQELEICKVFGVPPFLVNGTYEVKYGGLEQAMTVFINFSLAPLMRHIEQRLNTLLSAYEQEAYYFEFDFNILLRPDEKSRGEFYQKLFNMGAISPAMIAARENLEPPDEAGNYRFVPAQLMPLTEENMDAYMASAKTKAAKLFDPKVQDPARNAGDDKL